jgi:hypothetical protein
LIGNSSNGKLTTDVHYSNRGEIKLKLRKTSHPDVLIEKIKDSKNNLESNKRIGELNQADKIVKLITS